MRGYVKLLVSLFLMSAFHLFAEADYRVEKLVFLPLRFYVGDIVELRCELYTTGNMALRPPESMPTSTWVVVQKISVNKISESHYELIVLFTTFSPGSHILPAINLGQIIIDNIKVHTYSILDDEPSSEFKPIKGQLLLPYTWMMITFSFFLIFLFPVLCIVVIKRGIRFYKDYKIRSLLLQPRVKFRKALKDLEKKMAHIKPKDFFSYLTASMKEYLYSRFRLPVFPATTSELNHLLVQSSITPKDITNIIDLFQLADFVKFGGRLMAQEKMEQMIQDMIELVKGIEERSYVEP
jgi:hypothetical protein